ncbi:MAG: hypothetical protein RMJ51_02460 [Candidatus Calescibacterium sp.]|nr:hypothetical protein [Candidatus Calescibacterium sp.]MCX7972307.1 hypothetical protein [bacterium]MDW8195089.1 hypothetical protein [Candidatus Calescibacterium sp.]
MSRMIDTLETIMGVKKRKKKSIKLSQNYDIKEYYLPSEDYTVEVAILFALPAYIVQHKMLLYLLSPFGYGDYAYIVLWSLFLVVLFLSLIFAGFKFIKEGYSDLRIFSKAFVLVIFSLIVSVIVISIILGILTSIIYGIFRASFREVADEINRFFSIFQDLDKVYDSLIGLSIIYLILIPIEYTIYKAFLPFKDVMIFSVFSFISLWIGCIFAILRNTDLVISILSTNLTLFVGCFIIVLGFLFIVNFVVSL